MAVYKAGQTRGRKITYLRRLTALVGLGFGKEQCYVNIIALFVLINGLFK